MGNGIGLLIQSYLPIFHDPKLCEPKFLMTATRDVQKNLVVHPQSTEMMSLHSESEEKEESYLRFIKEDILLNDDDEEKKEDIQGLDSFDSPLLRNTNNGNQRQLLSVNPLLDDDEYEAPNF